VFLIYHINITKWHPICNNYACQYASKNATKDSKNNKNINKAIALIILVVNFIMGRSYLIVSQEYMRSRL
jgi:hypothetical protein